MFVGVLVLGDEFGEGTVVFELGRNQEASGAARWRDMRNVAPALRRPYRGGADGTADAITRNSEGTFLVSRRHKSQPYRGTIRTAAPSPKTPPGRTRYS